jgi:hypothetical protein
MTSRPAAAEPKLGSVGWCERRRAQANFKPGRGRGFVEFRYAACDPDNRLIAAQLEKSWETTIARSWSCGFSGADMGARSQLPHRL